MLFPSDVFLLVYDMSGNDNIINAWENYLKNENTKKFLHIKRNPLIAIEKNISATTIINGDYVKALAISETISEACQYFKGDNVFFIEDDIVTSDVNIYDNLLNKMKQNYNVGGISAKVYMRGINYKSYNRIGA